MNHNILFQIILLLILQNYVWNSSEKADRRQKRVRELKRTRYAVPHSKPWTALQLHWNEHHRSVYTCTAFLINRPPNHHKFLEEGSSDLLLTAAHCLLDNKALRRGQQKLKNRKIMSVIFGKHDISRTEVTERKFRVINTMVHKEYNSMYNATYDIGMIKLNRPVIFNSYIRSIPLTNTTIDGVSNCTVSAWGLADSGTMILTTAFMHTIKMVNGSLEQWSLIDSPEIESGDSGSALACKCYSHVVAQGIVHGTDITKEKGHVRKFSDIERHSAWIDWAFTAIDEHAPMVPELYHPKLNIYSGGIILEDSLTQIVDKIEAATGYSPGKQFFHEVANEQRSRDETLKIWFEHNVADFIEVHQDKFNLQGITGYSTGSSVFDCAVDCFLKNKNGSCSYEAGSKRCYYSDSVSPRSSMMLNMKNCVNIQVGLQEANRDTKVELEKFGSKVKTYNSIGSRDQLSNLKWNVSVNTEYSDKHCEAQLTSSDRVEYDLVHLSNDCYQYFRDLLKLKDSHLLEVDAIFDVSAQQFHSKAILTNDDSNTLKLLNKIPIPVSYGSVHGQLAPKPVVPPYEPMNGAFILGSFAAPFLAFITMECMEKIYIAALIHPIESFALRPLQAKDTEFLLTSGTFAETCFPMKVFATTGSNFGITSIYSSWTSIYDKQMNEDIRVFVSYPPIELNDFALPILLNSVGFDVKSLSFSIVALANSIPDSEPSQVYEIPVEIHSYTNVNGVNKVITRRLFARNGWKKAFPYVLDYAFLVAFDAQHGRHILYGLNTKPVNGSERILDEHTLVDPLSSTIQEYMKLKRIFRI